mmetsp:Transcript_2845/g.6576  ORF Transcript_2845/g.6576 Transcript_2845/m.6576 type:complete len:328 (-) Transcript_2845:317-1300(-)
MLKFTRHTPCALPRPTLYASINVTVLTSGLSLRTISTPTLSLFGPLKLTITSPISAFTSWMLTSPFRLRTAGSIFCNASLTTLSIFSVGERREEASTAEISVRLGKYERRVFSTPIFIVVVDEGQLPHAPSRASLMALLPTSTSTMATLPPSAMRKGRTSLRTLSTFAAVSSKTSRAPLASGAEVSPASESYGEMIWDIGESIRTSSTTSSAATTSRRLSLRAATDMGAFPVASVRLTGLVCLASSVLYAFIAPTFAVRKACIRTPCRSSCAEYLRMSSYTFKLESTICTAPDPFSIANTPFMGSLSPLYISRKSESVKNWPRLMST